MTRKLFEAYKNGTYKPRNDYYIETFKPIWIPTYKACDEECWYGPNHPRTHKEFIVKCHFDTHIKLNNSQKYDVDFEGNNIVFTIYPKETVQVLMDNGKYTYITKYLGPYVVEVDYRNIKAFY